MTRNKRHIATISVIANKVIKGFRWLLLRLIFYNCGYDFRLKSHIGYAADYYITQNHW